MISSSFLAERRQHTSRLRAWPLLAVVTAVAISACGGADDTGDSAAPAAGGTVDKTTSGDLNGQSVSVIHAFTGEDEAIFVEILESWAEPRGVDIQAETTGGEPLVDIRVESGNPPDIAVFPNPSKMEGFWDRGDLRSLEDVVDREDLESSLIPGVLQIGEGADGTLIGVPFRLSVKSLVWYSEPVFSEAGYEVPTTWDEMISLSEQIKADGITPWCIGIESGGATGWPATDWLEEIVLRTAGPDVYDQWVAHEIPFDDPVIVNAARTFEELAFTDGFVRGGRKSMVTTSFGDAPSGLFHDPPSCMLHRQANFITSFFPDDAQADLESSVGVFPFPAIDPGSEDLVLGAGDYISLFTENDAAEELVRFLSNASAGEAWAEEGGFLSPHATFDASHYADQITRDIGDQLTSAEAFRFDASDLMTAEIGSGKFWTEATAWINGDVNAATALSNVEQTWTALE